MFYYWGRFIARDPKLIIGLALLLLITAIPMIPAGLDRLSPDGWVDDASETRRAQEIIEERFLTTGQSIWIVFENQDGPITDETSLAEVNAALEPARSHQDVVQVRDFVTTGADQFISTDGRKTFAMIQLDADVDGQAVLGDLRSTVPTGQLAQYWGGGIVANQTFNDTVKRDLVVQEAIALPITLILLIIIFGAIVAASLPISVGLVAIGTAVGGISLLALLTDTSIYVLHVATMIGLALAIDYSLFIVSRFREEMAKHSVDEAVAIAVGTAGKAVFFAGLTVAIGLVGLTFFPMYAMRTMGLGGGIVVVLAVFYSLTILPALLTILGPRINKGRVRNVTPSPASSGGFWHWLAFFVMRRPLIILVTVLIVLISVGSPFLRANFAPPGIDLLPPDEEARIASDMMVGEFPGQQTGASMIVVVDTEGSVLEPGTFEQVRDLYYELSVTPGIVGIDSVFDLVPGGADADPQEVSSLLETAEPQLLGELSRFLTDNGTRFNLAIGARPTSSEAEALVRSVRDMSADRNDELTVLVTGDAAFNVDMMDGIRDTLPYALIFIFIITYVVLFLLLGSVILPFKAIIVNLLSLTAAFGALVWIFQEGNLSGLLAFDAPGYIVPMIAVIMFCVLFGLSMDYEVMMLSRMKEEYERTGDNTTAVAIGLERTGRVITGAALIMIVLFGAGISNNLVMMKSLGVGMAIAIFVDATIARGLLVPSAMRLMGKVNWWAPATLKRFQERVGMGEITLEVERQSKRRASPATGSGK